MFSPSHLSIRTRVKLGFGLIVLLMAALGGSALIGLHTLSQLVGNMHRHPLTVSNAVRDIRAGILSVHGDMRDVVLARDPAEVERLHRQVQSQDRALALVFDVVKERYLGDPRDVEAAREAFRSWRPIRQEVFALVEAGDREAAEALTRGAGAAHVAALQDLVGILAAFASGKADEYFEQAERVRRGGIARTVLLLVLILGLGLATAVVFSRALNRTIDQFMVSVGAVAVGDFSSPVPVQGSDELAAFAAAFNHMLEELARSTVSVRELNAEVQERRRIEEALQESRRQMARQMELTEAVYDTTPVGLGYLDTELRYLRVNDHLARLNGVPKEEHLGRTVREILPHMADVVEPLFRRVLATGDALMDFKFTTADPEDPGRPRHWRVSYHPVADEGAVIGINTVVRDVTVEVLARERNAAIEEKILETQKLESLGVLAGGIAHDFNNLLMSILGNADIALSDLSPVSPLRENLKDIETASRRAADLCRQMLAYSGRGRFVLKDVDLNEIVRELTHMMEVSISKKAVLKFDFARELPPIRVDVTQIRQIVLNLIVNASEAIGDRSGVITLRTGAVSCDAGYLTEYWMAEELEPGEYTFLEVSDTGCGMDPETRNRIFEPFFTTKFTGRGLGMAAVLGIVRGHKGAIKVYSEPGKGSSFKILFPALAGAVAEPTDKLDPADAWQGEGTVLLIDDEESVCVIGKRMLERFGFEVAIAGDGQQALEMLEAVDPVCVLLDLTMPRLDGEQTFSRIRRLRPGLPVIMTSGYNELEITERFVGKGLAGFIQKPYRLAALGEVLRRALDPSEPAGSA